MTDSARLFIVLVSLAGIGLLFLTKKHKVAELFLILLGGKNRYEYDKDIERIVGIVEWLAAFCLLGSLFGFLSFFLP